VLAASLVKKRLVPDIEKQVYMVSPQLFYCAKTKGDWANYLTAKSPSCKEKTLPLMPAPIVHGELVKCLITPNAGLKPVFGFEEILLSEPARW
jgi:hypothetical protein